MWQAGCLLGRLGISDLRMTIYAGSGWLNFAMPGIMQMSSVVILLMVCIIYGKLIYLFQIPPTIYQQMKCSFPWR